MPFILHLIARIPGKIQGDARRCPRKLREQTRYGSFFDVFWGVGSWHEGATFRPQQSECSRCTVSSVPCVACQPERTIHSRHIRLDMQFARKTIFRSRNSAHFARRQVSGHDQSGVDSSVRNGIGAGQLLWCLCRTVIFLCEYGQTTEVQVRSTKWTVAVGSRALGDSMVLGRYRQEVLELAKIGKSLSETVASEKHSSGSA